MKRFGAFALLAVMAAAGGCAAPAKFIERKADSGIVAIPNNSDSWPSYNRREALAMIQKHVGADYEILEEREVVIGQSTQNNQQVNTEQTLNKRNPARPGERQTATSTTTQQDITQWQIAYRKAPRPEPFIGDINNNGVTIGPDGKATVRTQYPAAGTMPNVQPAGGPISAFNRPRPATPASGGADCNH